jgi:dolichol-phosphate mannosyltransferase
MSVVVDSPPPAAPRLPRASHPSWWPGLSSRAVQWFAILIAASVLLRFLAMATVPLVPEEAYYWMYSQHPSLSYFDHPPMVAWVIGAGTKIFGDTEFGVRFVGCLLMLGTTATMYRFARAWYGRGAAIIATALTLVLPLFFGAGFIATMDSPLLFFWMVALIGVTAALKDGKWWGWYLAGIGLGGAMLSKYTGIFIAAGTGLSVLACKPWRRYILSPHPYLGLLLGFAMFTPVIVWNAQHNWASFRFQFMDRFEGKTFQIGYVLTFLAFQLAAATPMLLLGLGIVIARSFARRRRLFRPRTIVALAFGLPLMAVMAYKSLRYDIHINWTLPAFLSLLPAFAQWFLVRLRQHRGDDAREKWSRQITWTAAVCLAINLGLMLYLVTLQSRLRLITAFGPWHELAAAVEQQEDALEKTSAHDPLVVIDGPYRLPSIVAFYRKRLAHGDAAAATEAVESTTSEWIVGGRRLGYAYWADPQPWAGRDCIYVFENNKKDRLGEVRDRFDSVQMVEEIDIGRGHKSKRKYGIAICKGLRL